MNKTFEQVQKEILNAEVNPFEIYNELSKAIQFELRTSKETADKIITNAVTSYPVDLGKQMEDMEYRVERVIEMRYE